MKWYYFKFSACRIASRPQDILDLSTADAGAVFRTFLKKKRPVEDRALLSAPGLECMTPAKYPGPKVRLVFSPAGGGFQPAFAIPARTMERRSSMGLSPSPEG